RVVQTGYFNGNDGIEHMGKRGYGSAFMGISNKYKCTNLEWFKAQYPEEHWSTLVEQSKKIARKKAFEKFKSESNLAGAEEMIDQILSTKEARANYYGTQDSDSMEQLKHQYEIIYESLSKPIVRMESACFMWLVKK